MTLTFVTELETNDSGSGRLRRSIAHGSNLLITAVNNYADVAQVSFALFRLAAMPPEIRTMTEDSPCLWDTDRASVMVYEMGNNQLRIMSIPIRIASLRLLFPFGKRGASDFQEHDWFRIAGEDCSVVDRDVLKKVIIAVGLELHFEAIHVASSESGLRSKQIFTGIDISEAVRSRLIDCNDRIVRMQLHLPSGASGDIDFWTRHDDQSFVGPNLWLGMVLADRDSVFRLRGWQTLLIDLVTDLNVWDVDVLAENLFCFCDDCIRIVDSDLDHERRHAAQSLRLDHHHSVREFVYFSGGQPVVDGPAD